MRIDELLNVKVEDIDFSVRPTRVNFPNLNAKRNKGRPTRFSDEATYYLKQHLGERKHGYVFGAGDNSRSINEPMSEGNAILIFYTACQNVKDEKIRTELTRLDTNERHVYHPHMLRAIFRSKMGPEIGEHRTLFFMGRLKAAEYSKHTPEEIDAAYLKGMSAVTFLQVESLKQAEEIKNLGQTITTVSTVQGGKVDELEAKKES